MKIRILAALLAAVLAVACLPLGVFAQEGEADPCPPEEYDALYVKEGLVLQLDGYDEGTYNLETGEWYSKVGEGKASLLSPALWKERPQGGIGFDCDSFATWKQYRSNTGIQMDPTLFPEGDYSLEFVMTLDGLVDGEGRDVFHTQQMNNNIYGLYNGQNSAWCFGAFHTMQFMLSTAPQGNSLKVRPMYSLNGSYDETQYVNCLSDISMLSELHTASLFRVDYTVNFDAPDYPEANYRWTRDDVEIYVFNNKTSPKESTRCYLSNREGNFRLMGDFAGTVYGVRLYDRILTEEEKRQNLFVDFCRLAAVDVRGVAALPPEERQELYALTAGWPLSEAKERAEELQGVLDFYTGRGAEDVLSRLVSYEGIQMHLDEEAPVALRGVFRVEKGTLALLENRCTVRFGVLAKAVRKGEEPALDTLTVRDTGTGFLSEEAALLTVYSTLGDYGATGAWIDPERGTFGLSMLWQEEASLSDEVVFRAFASLTTPTGETVICYFDGQGELFGDPSARYGVGASPAEVADHLLNGYDEDPLLALSYGEEPVLLSTLAAVGGKPTPYYPGRDKAPLRVLTVGEEGFATLADALAEAKRLLSEEEAVSVQIRPGEGVHRLEETFTLSGAELGNPDSRFSLVGEGGKTVISGNRVLSGTWQQVEGAPYYAMQLDPWGEETPFFRTLTVNGALATPAHQGYLRYAEAAAEGKAPWRTGYVQNDPAKADYSYKVYLSPEAFAGLAPEEIPGVELHFEIEWEFKIAHVARVDFADMDAQGRVAVYLEGDDFSHVVGTNLSFQNRYFWAEGRLAFLDQPGEYYYDRAAGMLYYYPLPEEDISTLMAEASPLEQLFSFQGIEGLLLQEVTLTGTDFFDVERRGYHDGSQAGGLGDGMQTAAAIFGQDLVKATFHRVTVENVAGDGINLRGGNFQLGILNCAFWHIGTTAVRLGKGTADFNAGNCLDGARIENNHFEDIAWFLRENCALYITNAKDTAILHNFFKDTSYTCLSIGWRWSAVTYDPGVNYHLYNVEIAYNYFENFMTDMSDGGAIYTLGGNAHPDKYPNLYLNRMHGNVAVVNANTGAGNGRFMPLYHDGGSGNWHSYENVVFTHRGNPGLGSFYVQIGGDAYNTAQARNILIENNYFVGAKWWIPETIQGVEYTCTSEAVYLEKVIFWNHVRPQYRIIQQNNFCVPSEEYMDAVCREIVEKAGAELRPAATQQ